MDFLGTHQHVAVDLDLSVDGDGGLRIRSRGQRLRVAGHDLRCPRGLTGHADLHEWYDDTAGCYRIEVRVSHSRLGPIFGYHGSFTLRTVETTTAPAAVKPARENPSL